MKNLTSYVSPTVFKIIRVLHHKRLLFSDRLTKNKKAINAYHYYFTNVTENSTWTDIGSFFFFPKRLPTFCVWILLPSDSHSHRHTNRQKEIVDLYECMKRNREENENPWNVPGCRKWLILACP